jgi:tetratricopeptide (TPR) repeat protein
MRRGMVIGGVGIVVLASAGFWGFGIRLAAAPAAPAAPVVRATAPAPVEADARAVAILAGTVVPESRLDVRRLLVAGDFEPLTRIIEAKQASVEDDVRREGDLARIVLAFDTADPALAPFIDAWVKAAPASFAPRLARAQHGLALAWARRGTKWAKNTSEEQFQGMSRHLANVTTDALTALERNPRLGHAYGLLIRAAMAFGDTETCLRVAERGIAAVPAGLRVRIALANCLLPRWGGSYAHLEALARESARHLGENRALAALHGLVEWDRGRLAESSEEALQHYGRALAAGEHVYFYESRARTHLSLRRYGDALADADRALALEPEDPDLLVLRARALVALGRRADAGAIVRLVGEIDPPNQALAAFRRNELTDGAHEGYQLHLASDFNGAIARFTSAIALVDGNADVHYWRGRAYLFKEDHAHALADFERAIAFDAHHFESYRNVDYILAKRGDWDGVIRRWTEYLALEPANGRAYFERGGAYNQKGDRPAALADARKACELRIQEACGILLNGAAR